MKFPAILLVTAGLLSVSVVRAEDPKPEAAKDPATIVATVCSACHGADGNSVITTNPRLAGQHPEYLIKQLRNFKSGERKNPVMSGIAATLSDEDMVGLAHYFGSQKAKGSNAKENGAGSVGEKIYKGGNAANSVAACTACHGPTGAGIPVQFPRVSGQHAEYVVAQLVAFRSGERKAPMMNMIAAKLSDKDMAAVADYIQGLH